MNSSFFQKIIFGGGLIGLGIALFIAQISDAISAGEVFSIFVPLFVVAAGMLIIYQSPRSPWLGIIVTIVGFAWLLGNFIDISLGELWPLILVFIGTSIVFGTYERKHREDNVNISAFFWGSDRRIASESFTGGTLNAFMGGIDIDLRDVKIHKDGAHIVANAVLGGIDIKVPSNVEVIVDGIGILGGFDHKTRSSQETKQQGKLKISGTAILGGVEVVE